jgi:hypothetical protein
VAKRKRRQPNPFEQQEDKGLFSFDPARRYALKWGLIAGLAGGIFMIQPEAYFWQLVGVVIVILISNYHIGRASQWIPRWHATIMTMLGAALGMFGIIIVGTIVPTYLQAGRVAE